MSKKPKRYFFDPDAVNAAVARAREHSNALGKPLNIARVALNLGVTTSELNDLIHCYETNAEGLTADSIEVLKRAKQEAEADICDFLADKGNVTGYMFLGKCHHGMVETERKEIEFKGVVFADEDSVPD